MSRLLQYRMYKCIYLKLWRFILIMCCQVVLISMLWVESISFWHFFIFPTEKRSLFSFDFEAISLSKQRRRKKQQLFHLPFHLWILLVGYAFICMYLLSNCLVFFREYRLFKKHYCFNKLLSFSFSCKPMMLNGRDTKTIT